MKQLDKIVITSLEISGFRSYTDDYVCGYDRLTVITGDNGLGKSSQGEAIIWAFKGCTVTGDNKDGVLLNNNSKSTTVVIVFWDQDNLLHTLRRTRIESTTTITLDEVPKTQKNLDELIPPKVVFLCLFWPMYFSSLSDKEGRDFLVSIIPQIPITEVYKKMAESDSKLLNGLALTTPIQTSMFLTQKRKELKEMNETITFIDGKLEGIGNCDGASDVKLKELTDKKSKLISDKKTIYDNYMALRLSLQSNEFVNKLQVLESEVVTERTNYNNVKKDRDSVIPGSTCPSCKQEITVEYASNLKNSLNGNLNIIKAHGIKINTDIEETKQKFLAYKNELMVKITAAEESIKVNSEDISLLDISITEMGALLKKKKEYSNNQELRKKAVTETERLKCLIEAVNRFSIRRVELLSEKLSSRLKRTSIKLFNVDKESGEIKDCFKIMFDHKEFKLLSNSEKIKACLEIRDLVSYLTGYDYPVFVDNAESIVNFYTTASQVIKTIVVPGKQLSVDTTIQEGDKNEFYSYKREKVS